MGVADRSLPHDSIEWPTAAVSRRGVVLGHGAEHGGEFTSGGSLSFNTMGSELYDRSTTC